MEMNDYCTTYDHIHLKLAQRDRCYFGMGTHWSKVINRTDSQLGTGGKLGSYCFQIKMNKKRSSFIALLEGRMMAKYEHIYTAHHSHLSH